MTPQRTADDARFRPIPGDVFIHPHGFTWTCTSNDPLMVRVGTYPRPVYVTLPEWSASPGTWVPAP